MKKLLLLFTATLILTSCGDQKADELTEVVKGTCECSSEMVAFATKMKDAKPEDMQELMTKGQEMQAKAEECMKEKDLKAKSNALEKKLEEELGKEAAEEKMKAAMKEHCPDMYNMLPK